MWVKFETIYTEIDRFGNSRRFENRFEASGETYEISNLVNLLLKSNKLPGMTPLNSINQVNNKLIDYNYNK